MGTWAVRLGLKLQKCRVFTTRARLESWMSLTLAWLKTCGSDSEKSHYLNLTQVGTPFSASVLACLFFSHHFHVPWKISLVIWKPSFRPTVAANVMGEGRWFWEEGLGGLREGIKWRCFFLLEATQDFSQNDSKSFHELHRDGMYYDSRLDSGHGVTDSRLDSTHEMGLQHIPAKQ